MPDCLLQTLERYICNRTRGQVERSPGADRVSTIRAFGVAGPVASILLYNALDLAALVQLTQPLAA